MLSQIDEIRTLINARYPIIYVVSSEEDRVIKSIKDISKYPIYIWSVTCGIRKLEDISTVQESTKEPMAVLRFINNIREKAIFILLDYHPFLAESNYDVIRFLRELSKTFKLVQKNIVIISPILSIPIELEKNISVIDFPLPEKKDIEEIYNSIANDFKNDPKVSINGDKEHVVKALMGLNTDEISNVLYKSLVKNKTFSVDTIIGEKEQIIRKNGILEYYHVTDSLDIVGGMDLLKKWIAQRKNAFTDKARAYGLPYPRGVLLLGIAGCGKSLVCKTIANSWRFPLLRLDMGAVFDKMVGGSEANIRRATRLAESISPCILWIDEIEKGFAGTGSSDMSDGGTTKRVTGEFLTWMQDRKAPVFVIATANDISQLPAPLLRKGRFDDIFFVDLPNSEERLEIFDIHITKRNRNIDNFDMLKLVDVTNGYSGAEIESAIISALYDSYDLNRELTTEDILTSVKATFPLSKTMEEEISSLRSWAKNRARPTTSNLQIESKRGIDL